MQENGDLNQRRWLPIWRWLGGLALLIVMLLAVACGAIVYRARSQAYLHSVVGNNNGWTRSERPQASGNPVAARIRAAMIAWLGEDYLEDVVGLGTVTFDDRSEPYLLSREQTKAICAAGARFPRLQEFSIRSESFTLDQIADWPHLRRLTSLRIESPRLSDADLARIGHLSKLEELSLTSSAITDEGVKQLAGLANVQSLTLASPQITDAGPLSLPWLTQLIDLHLARTQVTDDCLDEIAKAQALRWLTLDGTKVTDEGLAKLEGTALEGLGLDETEISDRGMASLGRMKRLIMLSLSDTQVTGEQMHHFLGPDRLYMLDLDGATLTRAGYEQIARLHVERLDLRRTPLDDEELMLFLESPVLQFIDVRQTNVSLAGARGFIAADLARLQKKKDQSPDKYVSDVGVRSDFPYDQLRPQSDPKTGQ